MILSTAAISTCRVYLFGVVEYAIACRLQEKLSLAHSIGRIGDILLMMEHLPVLSVGKAGYKPEHLLVSNDILEKEHISFCYSNRGGGITYHGTGQIVCYPILNLKKLGITVRQYIEKLEAVLLKTLEVNGITGRRVSGSPGVWVGDAEIASIGIKVSHGITMHGFTLNICNDLKPFSYIAPCGIAGKKMTTISQVCGSSISTSNIIDTIIKAFSTVFGIETTCGDTESLEVCYECGIS